jgi:hypothetical protein
MFTKANPARKQDRALLKEMLGGLNSSSTQPASSLLFWPTEQSSNSHQQVQMTKPSFRFDPTPIGIHAVQVVAVPVQPLLDCTLPPTIELLQ